MASAPDSVATLPVATLPATTLPSTALPAARHPAAKRIPVVVRVLLIYLGSRVVSFGFFIACYAVAPALHLPYASFYSTRPNFIRLLSGWDGQYYKEVALHGYPSVLPVDAAGHVLANAWAFLPVYPWLSRGFMLATGLSFSASGVIVALVAGMAAAMLFYRLLAPRLGERRTLWAVVLFSAGPMTFVFELTYAESLFLALILASLLLIQRRRYLLAIPFGVVAAFTRPGELAIAATLGILLIVQLVRRERVPVGERIRMIVAGAVLAVAGFAWPVIADTVTGNKSAYFDTELSWWTGWVGRVKFLPFEPWFDLFSKYAGAAGVIFVLLVMAAYVVWLTRRPMRILGDELLAFTGSYAAYLFSVFLPQQSIARLVIPLAPLLGTPVFAQTRRSRAITLSVLVFLQPFAILVLWFLYPP